MQTCKHSLIAVFIVALLALTGQSITAQVTTETMSMSQGSHPALVLELPGAEDKMVEKMWQDFTKKQFKGKTKKERKSKEYQTLNVEIPGVSAGSAVDMYAEVLERGNGSELTVWIGSNDGWINPEDLPRRYVEAEKMLMRFGLDVQKAQIQLMVEEEEKVLKNLEKELDGLRKDKDRYEKNIEKAKAEIAENESNIEENKKAQTDKEAAIEEQRKKVEETRKKGDF